MYSAHSHGWMIAHRVRVGSYRRALEQAVKPGAVVVDIGTGTGLLAIFSCKLGARKVFAIESGEIIELARQIAKDNGYADRIEFIRDLSTRVELPERADVIVADLHGATPALPRQPRLADRCATKVSSARRDHAAEKRPDLDSGGRLAPAALRRSSVRLARRALGSGLVGGKPVRYRLAVQCQSHAAEDSNRCRLRGYSELL